MGWQHYLPFSGKNICKISKHVYGIVIIIYNNSSIVCINKSYNSLIFKCK